MEEVLRSAQQGDRLSREQLLLFLHQKLSMIARRRLGVDTEDAVHTTLIRVQIHLTEFRTLGDLLSFAHQVLRTELRVLRRRGVELASGIHAAVAASPASESLTEAEVDDRVLDIIYTLAEEHPDCGAVLLGLYEGVTAGQLCRRLRISARQLRRRAFVCRQNLALLLLTEDQGELHDDAVYQ
jgi:DNA-directed RNA polymerase specialized sigma24 family protein